MKKKTKTKTKTNNTLSIPRQDIKIVERGKSDTQTHKNMITHNPGLGQEETSGGVKLVTKLLARKR